MTAREPKRIHYRIGYMVVVAMTVVAGLGACGRENASGRGSDGRSRAQSAGQISRPEQLLEWMADHPESAGLVVAPDRGSGSLDFGGDRRFPLASMRKVLVLGALSASGEGLQGRVPRAEIERFYAPGTDGGAHERARLDGPSSTLEELARAAVEVSDNAAADALLDRVGLRSVDTWARGQGLRRQDPILPVLGELAAWTRDPQWEDRSPAERAKRAQELAGRVRAREVRLPSLAEQRRLAASSAAGTPAEWAGLMRRIGLRGDPRLVDLLDWPRRKNPKLRKGFTRYLTKGGSLPGIVTEASYIRPRGRSGVGVALFLRDLPPAVEAALQRTFVQQQLIARLAADPTFRDRARRVLARG